MQGVPKPQSAFCPSVKVWPLKPQIGPTVKFIPLLAAPLTVTTTFPVMAPDGTDVAMLVTLQLVAIAVVPLNVTVPEDPKFVPVIVTAVPTGPAVADKLVIVGARAAPTVKSAPLLATPATVTTTFPVVAPEGTEVTRLVALQLVTVAVVPLNLTVLVPCVDPKFVPVIVTGVPTGPEVVDKLEIVGVPCSVYVALANALFVKPALVATAFTTVVFVTVKELTYV
jgi:hypothetical protein